MKKIIIFTMILFTVSISFSQSANLVLNAIGSQPYVASNISPFTINAGYNYSGINPTSNVTVKIIYDNSVLDYINCASAQYTFTSAPGSGTTTILTCTFAAGSSSNAGTNIPMCFSFKCPQTCFGVTTNTIFSGSISTSSPSLMNATLPLTVSGIVNNSWSGAHGFFSFISTDYKVTFKVTLNKSDCHKITNPKFIVTPNIGTLAGIQTLYGPGATFVGNNIVFPFATYFDNMAGSTYDYNYTIQLPCNTPAGTIITCGISLYGENCGIPNSLIKVYTPASFTLPSSIVTAPSSTLLIQTFPGTFAVSITNTGNTSLDFNLDNILPIANTDNITSYTNQPSGTGMSGTINWVDCSNVNSATAIFNLGGASNTKPISTVFYKKNIINLVNLLPGYYITFRIYYNMSNSCLGIPSSNSVSLSSTLSYNCSSTSSSCIQCGNGIPTPINQTSIYNLSPLMQCGSATGLTNCYKPGDIIDLCISFQNGGDATLLGGVLNYPLPSYLSYVPGFDTYTGFPSTSPPIYQAGTDIKWSLGNSVVNSNSNIYQICFKVKVNSNAPFGTVVIKHDIYGSNWPTSSGWLNNCWQSISICQVSSYKVDKLVNGNKDGSLFSLSGNGDAGSIANYKITVTNTGTTDIGNLTLIDRLPFVGDKKIMDCNPRNSAFTIQPSSSFAPIAGVSLIEYSTASNILTGWPTACTSTGTVGSFSNLFASNNVKFKLANAIAPGGNFTFQFPVIVDANASASSQACNTIGLIGDAVNSSGATLSSILPVESNPACLTIASPSCQCGQWSSIGYILGNRSNKFLCGNNTQLEAEQGDFFQLRPRYVCLNDAGDSCGNGNIKYNIYYPNGGTLLNQSSLNNFKLDSCGVNRIVMIPTCGGVECQPCEFFINVNCCKCPQEYNPTLYWNTTGGPVADTALQLICGRTYTDKLECLKSYTIATIGACGVDCVPDSVITTISNGLGYNQVSYNLIGTVFSVNQIGTYTVTIKIKCGGKWCKTCIIKFVQTKKCEPVCNNCTQNVQFDFDASTSSATESIFPKPTILNTNFTLFGGSDTYSQVRVNVIDFQLSSENPACLQCYNSAGQWGSLIGGSLPGFTSAISTYPSVGVLNPNNNPREIVFNATVPSLIPMPTTLNLGFQIPGANPLACCCIDITMYLKITYRNSKCEECIKIIEVKYTKCGDKKGEYKDGGQPQFRMHNPNNDDLKKINTIVSSASKNK